MRAWQRLALTLLCLLLAEDSIAQQHAPSADSLETEQVSVPGDTVAAPDPLLWRLESPEFIRFIHEDVADLLRYLPGAFAIDRGRVGQLATVSIRGSTGAEARVFLGDRPVGDPFDGDFDVSSLPVLPIQSVGVYRTGAFLPFGQTALGALRIEPKTHRGDRPASIVRFRDGYYGYDDVEARYSQRISKHASIALGGGLRDVTGLFQNTAHQGENAYIDLRLVVPSAWDARYFVLRTRNDADVPGPHVPEGVLGIRRHRKEVRIDHMLRVRRTEGRSSVAGIAYASTLLREFRERASGLFLVHSARSAGMAVEWAHHGNRHELSGGGGIDLGNLSGDVISTGEGMLRLYIRDRFRLLPNWVLGLQTGVEKPRRTSPFVTLTGHLLWSVAPTSRLWWGVERHRRTPSAMERLWPGEGFIGDPDLQPAPGWAVEFGGSAGSETATRLRAALFYRSISDWIGLTVSDSLFRPANLGQRRLYGVDVDAYLAIGERVRIGALGQWRRVVESAPEKRLDLPEVVGTAYAGVGQTFFQDLDVEARLFVRVLGQRWSATLTGPQELEARVLFDAMLVLKFKDAHIFFSMEDVFDRRVEEVWGFPKVGQVFRWGLNWQFFD